jgi:hypothetical protein
MIVAGFALKIIKEINNIGNITSSSRCKESVALTSIKYIRLSLPSYENLVVRKWWASKNQTLKNLAALLFTTT